MLDEHQFRHKLLITKSTSPEEMVEYIQTLREKKGKEKETLKLIDEALSFGHDFVTNLFFEEALTYQHMVMNDFSNKKAFINMQNAILKADFYIQKYSLAKWLSRYYRFLGRIEDYRKDFRKACSYYKKAIKYVGIDPEPYRILELEGFLLSSELNLDKYKDILKRLNKLLIRFENTKVGIDLKKHDYKTWAIWKSGIVIRTINSLVERHVGFNKDEVNKLILEVKDDMKPEKRFEYRVEELNKLRLKLN